MINDLLSGVWSKTQLLLSIINYLLSWFIAILLTAFICLLVLVISLFVVLVLLTLIKVFIHVIRWIISKKYRKKWKKENNNLMMWLMDGLILEPYEYNIPDNQDKEE